MEAGPALELVAPQATARAPAAPSVHSQRLDYLDGWRGLSILAVLAGHFAPLAIYNTGRLGVEMFFVLSGRLMADVLFVERFPLGSFFRRRVARVWPGLFVFVALMAVVFHGPGPLAVQPIDIASSLTFTGNYVRIYLHNMGVLDHTWSLCVEEWGYLVLGLVALSARRFGFNPLLAIAGLAIACVANGMVQSGLGLDYYAVYWRTDVRMGSILMAAAVYLAQRQAGLAWPAWTTAAFGGLALMLSVAVVPDAIKYSLGTLCLSLALVGLDQAPQGLRRLLADPVLTRIGLWSFSLYLWQHPFFRLIGRAPEPLLLAGAVACALASFYLVEQPARRWLNRRWRAPKALSAAA
ncbi:acyltransferase family protein [Phenylobacterium montanum]|uniref:Acyltransferase n=1 Tax=Phenylobacterium montanum TaxID=2823693 RepID=A0A975ITA2_9CAUL|nr:acyltransferase [Caulobacter sp. S6]QUD86568.1 acyltransferase [Caulobacter sp. S6]